MSISLDTLLVRTTHIAGGRLRLDGTRLTVNQLVTMYKQGYTAEELASEFRQVTAAQVYAALAYYHANREEVERELAAEAEEDRKLKAEFLTKNTDAHSTLS